MTRIGDGSRHSAAIAASAALHVGLLLMLAGRGIVHLGIESLTLLNVDLIEASDRTAGPGERSDALRMAAASVAPAPAASPPTPSLEAEKVAPPPRIAVARRPPAPAAPSPAVREHSPAPAPEAGAGTAQSGAAAATAGGRDSVSAAPAWAPTARVRYEELLFSWMARHKQYPLLAQRRGIEGSGAVRVRIDRSGHLLEDAIVRSTGESLLDDAALDMVRRANPFPGVPGEYAGESFEFVAPIEYRLR